MSPEKVKICERFGNLDDAVAMATEAHNGQKRKSGEDAITHPLAVVRILREEMGIENPEILIAGVLHDCVEDADVKLTDIKDKFGGKVEEIVDGVTKIKGKTDESTTKRVVKLTSEVGIVKLADRLHNMRTLNFMPRNKQIEKAHETLRVYSVLAQSLGMWKVKTELEDLCFFYLDPDDYEDTKRQIEIDSRMNENFVESKTGEIENILENFGFDVRVETRHCGVWEARRKQRKFTLDGAGSMDDLKAVKDITRFEILVDKVDVDRAVSALTDNIDYPTDPRIVRLIGKNKTNTGYEAVHLVVNYEEGPVEIAILTQEMQENNDWGKVSLLRHGETCLGEVPVVRVFDMSGKLRLLPNGASLWDMAALISDSVLGGANYATVNGRRVKNLNRRLDDGDQVEIHTNGEVVDLRSLACLPQTREKIKSILDAETKLKLVSKGKDMMRTILAKRGLLDLADLGKRDDLSTYFGCNNNEELYIKLGNGSTSTRSVASRMRSIGITKRKLNLSTIECSGSNPGNILYDVYGILRQYGGEIKIAVYEVGPNSYYLRIVFEGRLRCKQRNELLKRGNCIIV